MRKQRKEVDAIRFEISDFFDFQTRWKKSTSFPLNYDYEDREEVKGVEMGPPPIPIYKYQPPPLPPGKNISSIPFSPPKRSIGQNITLKQQQLDNNSYPGEITFRHILGNGNGGPTLVFVSLTWSYSLNQCISQNN